MYEIFYTLQTIFDAYKDSKTLVVISNMMSGKEKSLYLTVLNLRASKETLHLTSTTKNQNNVRTCFQETD